MDTKYHPPSKELVDIWERVIDKIKITRRGFAVILRKAIPLKLENNIVVLGFHPDSSYSRSLLDAPDKIAIVRDAFQECLGHSVHVQITTYEGTLTTGPIQNVLAQCLTPEVPVKPFSPPGSSDKSVASTDAATAYQPPSKELLDIWDRVLSDIKSIRRGIVPILRKAIPLKLDENVLVLGFHPESSFARAQLEKPNIVTIISETIQKHTGDTVSVQAITYDGTVPIEPMQETCSQYPPSIQHVPEVPIQPYSASGLPIKPVSTNDIVSIEMIGEAIEDSIEALNSLDEMIHKYSHATDSRAFFTKFFMSIGGDTLQDINVSLYTCLDALKITKLCESPIESSFAEAAIGVVDGLVSQFEVKKYRLDFAIPDKKIAIEIDGHDYHKTKEQRTNDAQRERFLQEQGWFVVRFTGSEVYKSDSACVEQLNRIIKMRAV